MLSRRRIAQIALLVVFVDSAAMAGNPSQADNPGLSPRETQAALQQAAADTRDLRQLAAQYRAVPAAPRVVNADPPIRTVGQVDSFWVSRQNPTEHFQVEAELRFVSRHAYWYVQTGFEVGEASLRRSADVFDAQIYPGVRRLVGSEAFPGVDNDPRITIFNGNVPGVSGYVWSPDSYPHSVHPYSNERDMVYLNLRSVEPGTLDYHLTLSHEFTHLVHQNVNPADDTWVKEGLADFVANTLFPERELAVGAFFSQPDVQLTSWSDGLGGSPPTSAHYQSASWFMRYLVDRFGVDALGALLARDRPGPLGIDAFLRGSGLTPGFDDLFREWTIANLGPASGGQTVSPYVTWPQLAPNVRSLELGRSIDEYVSQYGADYFEIVPGGGLSLTFTGATTTPVASVAPDDAHSMWYSGRADTSVASMSRTLDLRGTEAATLSYQVWYDLEQDYDFGYVAASTDNGQTWKLLETPRMSRANGTGNNLGLGYTGSSGGAGAPGWVTESIDLKDFAGQVVTIRFSYVTDDAFVREGMGLNDIRLVVPGRGGEAESDEMAWMSRGWSRVGDSVSQTWSVTLIGFRGSSAQLIRVPVDDNGRGQWSSGDETMDRIIIAVSGTAPVITQKAFYRLQADRG